MWRPLEILAGGSSTEAVGAAGSIVISIVGLAGYIPQMLAAIATIAIGGALLIQGAWLTQRFSQLFNKVSEGRLGGVEFGGGITVEVLGGIAGVALGILGLLDYAPMLLLPVAAIVFGGSLVLGSYATCRLNSLAIVASGVPERVEAATRDALFAASGVDFFIGFGVIAMGILALLGFSPTILTLVSTLGVATAVLLSGTAITGRILSFFVH
ncbi:MAG: hypothetical protein NT049_10465 [Planctomycetota bacterium]|nr:hypothetical protein [Planctomycetota bacterium]